MIVSCYNTSRTTLGNNRFFYNMAASCVVISSISLFVHLTLKTISWKVFVLVVLPGGPVHFWICRVQPWHHNSHGKMTWFNFVVIEERNKITIGISEVLIKKPTATLYFSDWKFKSSLQLRSFCHLFFCYIIAQNIFNIVSTFPHWLVCVINGWCIVLWRERHY